MSDRFPPSAGSSPGSWLMPSATVRHRRHCVASSLLNNGLHCTTAALCCPSKPVRPPDPLELSTCATAVQLCQKVSVIDLRQDLPDYVRQWKATRSKDSDATSLRCPGPWILWELLGAQSVGDVVRVVNEVCTGHFFSPEMGRGRWVWGSEMGRGGVGIISLHNAAPLRCVPLLHTFSARPLRTSAALPGSPGRIVLTAGDCGGQSLEAMQAELPGAADQKTAAQSTQGACEPDVVWDGNRSTG